MKNFVIITLIFSLLSFLIGLASPDFTFLGVGLAFTIIAVCLVKNLGAIKGIASFLIFTLLPGMIESYGFKWSIPFFQGSVVQHITHSNWRFALDPQTISSVMVITILFSGSLVLSHTLNNLISSNRFKKLRHIIVAALLVALTFINTVQGFNGLTVLRWFVIPLVIFTLFQTLFRFHPVKKIYTSLPITLYYFLPTYIAFGTKNYSIFLLMALVGTIHLFLYILKSPSFQKQEIHQNK